MSAAWRAQLALLPERLGEHLFLTAVALLVGVAVGVPLGIACLERPVLRRLALALTGVVQTVPSLALLALMVAATGTIGRGPALIALSAYSILPILRNTVAGLQGTSPELIEAGVGLGMTDAQVLMQVRLPPAIPMIMAGIRTAAVWTVGIATLSTPVGATSLGNFIFAGLQTRNTAAVLVGCAAAAALALAIDVWIGAIERELRGRRAPRAAVLAGGFVVCVVATIAATRRGGEEHGSVRIGAKTFTEQYVLARLIASRLERAGVASRAIESLGSTVAFDALAAGEIDVYVDYSGTIWTNHMRRTDHPGREQVLAGVSEWLEREHGIVCLGGLGFENAYAFAMTRERARELGVTDLGALARRSPELSLGSDYEFIERPEWEAVRAAYGLAFRELASFDPALMYGAVANGQVDAIAAFSTDGRIDAFELVLLGDPRGALPPYDALLLLSRAAAARPEVALALRPLVGAIDSAAMRRSNRLVDLEALSVDEAARELDSVIERR